MKKLSLPVTKDAESLLKKNRKRKQYAATSLEKKLGLKENFRIRLVNIPDNYFELFSQLPDGLQIIVDPRARKHFIHYFTTDAKRLWQMLPALKTEMEINGMIWVSWPKKSSGITSNVSEDLIRTVALNAGLVDIKVCAVDDDWSGLKLVIPLKLRPDQNAGK